MSEKAGRTWESISCGGGVTLLNTSVDVHPVLRGSVKM